MDFKELITARKSIRKYESGIDHEALAGILKEGIIRGTVDPFQGEVADQGKRVRSTQDSWFRPEELMRMNWLCDNVIGHIPTVDELLPMARETTRLLALPEDAPQPAPAN